MKQKDRVTLRGQILTRAGPEAPQKLQLFDGKFDTGYRITKFVIMPEDMDNTSSRIFAAKIGISPNIGDARDFNWQDNRELAWAVTTFDANGISITGPVNLPTDYNSIVIEDLYLYSWEVASGQAVNLNYFIELERVELTDAMGAVTMSSYKASRSGQSWIP
jgi:hypothetical protein